MEGCQILAGPVAFGSSVSFSEYSGYSPWTHDVNIGCVARESYSIPQFFYFPYDFLLETEDVGLEGQAIMMLLSGFRNPEDNNDGEPFNTWYLTPEGGDFILLSEDKIANIQFVHNAPDASIEEVDVFANGMLVGDDLSFKTGTSFIPVVLDQYDAVNISIRDASNGDILLNEYVQSLTDQENYYAVIDGILDTDAYTDVAPFGVYVYEGARLEASDPDSELDLEIMVHHGTIGFDHTLDVQGTQILAAPLRLGRLLLFSDYSDDNDFTYSAWSSQESIAIEIGDYGGNIGGGLLSDFQFNFSFELPSESIGLEDQAILMLLSGFQDPSTNNDGQLFDVFYLTPEGGEFRSATLSVDDITSSAITVYPNPVQEILTIKTLSAQAIGVIYDLQGRLIYENILIQDTTTIDVSALKSGIYFLQLTDQNNNASTVRRIIKM
ncbi:T9SS type A sorting domain-containing protein [uncultured Dokdonia sp.]|uniref:T9SS type A sorting domain-containing protein n=1 Tax=uncultured Dokdonia sp. TaxID=575653 RepID=UPI0026029C49|nr:T9SS type A sorting domain-containing protein [uncultured Dokdonia sp.]